MFRPPFFSLHHNPLQSHFSLPFHAQHTSLVFFTIHNPSKSYPIHHFPSTTPPISPTCRKTQNKIQAQKESTLPYNLHILHLHQHTNSYSPSHPSVTFIHTGLHFNFFPKPIFITFLSYTHNQIGVKRGKKKYGLVLMDGESVVAPIRFLTNENSQR